MKTKSDTFLLNKTMLWEPAGNGVQRQIMGYDGRIMLVKVKFEKGAVGSEHAHYHSQTSYVASGRFEVNINGEKQILEAGEGYYVEPDAPHSCICLEEGVLIDSFAPLRADFLKK